MFKFFPTLPEVSIYHLFRERKLNCSKTLIWLSYCKKVTSRGFTENCVLILNLPTFALNEGFIQVFEPQA